MSLFFFFSFLFLQHPLLHAHPHARMPTRPHAHPHTRNQLVSFFFFSFFLFVYSHAHPHAHTAARPSARPHAHRPIHMLDPSGLVLLFSFFFTAICSHVPTRLHAHPHACTTPLPHGPSASPCSCLGRGSRPAEGDNRPCPTGQQRKGLWSGIPVSDGWAIFF